MRIESSGQISGPRATILAVIVGSATGRRTVNDLQALHQVGDLADLLKNCKCTLCQSATTPVFDAVTHFRADFPEAGPLETSAYTSVSLDGAGRLGITAGASAPETLVDELIAACRARYEVTVEEVRTTEESVVFKLPRALVA